MLAAKNAAAVAAAFLFLGSAQAADPAAGEKKAAA